MILRAWALLIRCLWVLRLAMASTGPKFECWNQQCPKYIGKGVFLTSDEVWSAENSLLRCNYCQSYVLHKGESDQTSTLVASGSASAAAGAVAGAAVGGPVGAFIGMVAAGAVMAFIFSESQKRSRKPRPKARKAAR